MKVNKYHALTGGDGTNFHISDPHANHPLVYSELLYGIQSTINYSGYV
jgi:hypothetical protein